MALFKRRNNKNLNGKSNRKYYWRKLSKWNNNNKKNKLCLNNYKKLINSRLNYCKLN